MFQLNNRVQLALPRLPEEVRRNGVIVQKRSNDILLVIGLQSPKGTRNTTFLANYAQVNLIDELKRIPGVGDVTLFGSGYSMRIWLQPDKMARLGVTPTDIANAIRAQNAQYAAGKIGAEPAPPGQALNYTVTARGRLVKPEEFGEIVVRAGGPSGVLRIKDVARVELGAQSYDTSTTVDGNPAVGMAVFLQTGANALEVAGAVKSRMVELKAAFPQDVDYLIPFDTTRVVEASIHEVVDHDRRGGAARHPRRVRVPAALARDLIPMLAVPVSLIGTFAGLYALGFSINTLTLFAMVLAIGIVVDDAIVVLENVERLMREEKHEREAGVDRGHAGSLRRGPRDRARAVRGVHPGRVPRRHRGRALQAVRGDGRDLRRHLGLRRAHAHARAVRAAAEDRETTSRACSGRSTSASRR